MATIVRLNTDDDFVDGNFFDLFTPERPRKRRRRGERSNADTKKGKGNGSSDAAGDDDEPKFVQISPGQISLLHTLVSSLPSVNGAISVLNNFFFANGFQLKTASGKSKLSDDFLDRLQLEWTPFAFKALKSLMIYRMLIISKDNQKRPYVIWPHEVNIEYRRRRSGELEYRVAFKMPRTKRYTGRPDLLRNGIVFVLDPPSFDKIQTPFNSLVDIHRFVLLFKGCTLRSAQIQSHPPLILQHQRPSSDDREIGAGGIAEGDIGPVQGRNLADPDRLRIDHALRSDSVVRNHPSFLDASFSVLRAPPPANAAGVFPYSENQYVQVDSVSGIPKYPTQTPLNPFAHSVITLPEGLEVSSGQRAAPLGIQFLSSMLERMTQETAFVTGVPESFFNVRSGSGARAPVVSIHSAVATFYRTTQRWAPTMRVVLESTFQWIYATDIIYASMDEVRKGKADSPSHRVTVSFPVVIDPVLIQTLFDQGRVDFATSQRLLERFFGFAPDVLSDKRLDPETGELLRDVVMKQREEEGIQRTANALKRKRTKTDPGPSIAHIGNPESMHSAMLV